jgi:cytochrome b6-f complex iron-sulfur subunit
MSLNSSERPECRGCSVATGYDVASFAQDDGIGRRTFLVQSGIMAAIAALNACGSLGVADVTSPNVPANSTITIGNYPSLATVGGVAMITIGSAPIAVVRTGSSDFIALSRICPHQGGIVNLSRNDFVCPRHGATYNLTGQWIGGQPAGNLHQYTTSYDSASGTLTIS